MSLLIESIKLLDGEFYNLFYHEQRINKSLKELCGIDEHSDLERFLKKLNYPDKGLYKCRIIYDDTRKEIEFVPYTPRPIQSLKIVENNRVRYDHKYNDRRTLDKLYAMRGECDDILIVKDNLVTDTYYCNIVFRRNSKWYTPWSTLLAGTMRQSLIDKGVIEVEMITKDDINSFSSCKLINAMLGFDGPEIETSAIILS